MKFTLVRHRKLFAIALIVTIAVTFFFARCMYYKNRSLNFSRIPAISSGIPPSHLEKWMVIPTVSPPTESIKRPASIPGWMAIVDSDDATSTDWRETSSRGNINYFDNINHMAETSDNDHHEKWIVITAVSPPTNNFKRLAAIPGWKLIVVGDETTPTNWNFSGCTFLGLEEQTWLGYAITELIPSSSYMRKNIGYLYAIQHGAKFIYDTEDNSHFDNLLKFSFEPTMSGLIYMDEPGGIMNPFAHFGQPSIWPRGYPLDKVIQRNKNTYKLSNFWTPVIQQGIDNGDPDLVSVRDENGQSPKIKFDHHAPPVVLQNGIFAPFNSRSTLFHRDAFWALMLPLSVRRTMTDIWRGYWAQRLLWLIGQRLAFFPPESETNQSHTINLANNLCNEEFEEINLQYKVLIETLASWKCNNTTLFQCMYHLSITMVELKLFSQVDVRLVQAWQTDLKDIGYQQPMLVINPMNIGIDDKLNSVSHPRANHIVYYTPPKFDSISERRLDLLTFCGAGGSTKSADLIDHIDKDVSYSFANVLLIILFNEKYFKNMNFLDTLYRDHFPNIVICCPMGSYEEMTSKINEGFPKGRSRQFTFLNLTTETWYFAYECTIRVIEMNYQVDGYLVIGDDVLLNLWNFKYRDLNQVQFIYEGNELIHRDTTWYWWYWWSSKMTRIATGDAFDEIERIANGTDLGEYDKKIAQIMKTFVRTRYKNNVNMTLLMVASADIYYVPRSKSEDFVELMKVFLRHQSFLEVAVPAVMLGLFDSDVSDVSYHALRGYSLWSFNRQRVFKFFNTNNDFIHPFKISQLYDYPNRKKEYCDIYIRELMNRW